MKIAKAEIVTTLHSRGLNARADWVERELPELVDTDENATLLQRLGIDLAAMSPVDAPREVGRRPTSEGES